MVLGFRCLVILLLNTVSPQLKPLSSGKKKQTVWKVIGGSKVTYSKNHLVVSMDNRTLRMMMVFIMTRLAVMGSMTEHFLQLYLFIPFFFSHVE